MNTPGHHEVAETVVVPNILFELVSENGERYQISSDMLQRTMRIGRGNSCDLRFTHPTVSASHATLSSHAGRAAITDIGSSGGTMVNGIKLVLNQPQTLHRGDVIILGGCRINVK